MVQSGPMRRSLVAFSTATVAEEEDDDEMFILPLSLSAYLCFRLSKRSETDACLVTEKVKKQRKNSRGSNSPSKYTPP
ncbi:hypothetical protein G2W53_016619 [Senna tora]|uniref:Uncharacterized protein n=1 Tax=Senna tora TaxID=362788 RepID=A0A834WJH0_9FABA|nr:hypothetical protein G2W53_016619 [Senna tora]